MLGDGYSCARKDDGSVRCWGSNALGSLGDGKGGPSAPDSPAPVVVAGILDASSKLADLALEDATACLRATDGNVFCWGDGSTDLFGASTDAVLSPKRMMSASAVYSGAGAKHLCIGDTARNLRCWGANLTG